ncbi:MAG: DUF4249 domain-containing protein [Bacteroidetes bacterium]|nr:DUF4249 domain-containing protein [Bacteroidota bacterium]
MQFHITQIRYILILIASISLIGCEKNVTVEIPKADEQIVVEGYIETGQYPFVILSKTLPFFGSINTSTTSLLANTVTGALITLNDGTTIDTLNQLTGIDYGIYSTARMRGEVGKTYSLTISVNGKTLKAVTSIPNPVVLDSVWWKVDGQRDSLGFAWAHLTDPDTLGNCYRWFAQRINHYTYGDDIGKIKDSTFIAPQGSVFEDKFFNARSFDINAIRGQFLNSQKEDDQNEESIFFKRGDTIVLKFCSIDRSHFEFWRTEETQVGNNGNPFGSPAPITSNIEGGLGIWGGYATTFDTIIAR